MHIDKEFAARNAYIRDLKYLRSGAYQIIRHGNEAEVSDAGKKLSLKLNQLLMHRNIVSAKGCLFLPEMAFINRRKDRIELLDIDHPKEDLDRLWEVVRRIDNELESM